MALNIFDESPKLIKKLASSYKKLFSSKLSFGHVNCRFGRHSKIIQLKVKRFSAQKEEMMKKNYNKKKVFSKRSTGDAS